MADREPASARTISIDDGTPRPWAQARVCLAQAPTHWLATVRPDGRPHLVPVAPTIGFGFGTSEPARSTRWRFQPSHIRRR
jgi:hypothetical protein